MRKQTYRILQILGKENPEEGKITFAVSIIRDRWAFKLWRLKKLIYG
jgi:hypothetical protein